MFRFHVYCLDSLLQDMSVRDPSWSADCSSKGLPCYEVQRIEVRGVCWLVKLTNQCFTNIRYTAYEVLSCSMQLLKTRTVFEWIFSPVWPNIGKEGVQIQSCLCFFCDVAQWTHDHGAKVTESKKPFPYCCSCFFMTNACMFQTAAWIKNLSPNLILIGVFHYCTDAEVGPSALGMASTILTNICLPLKKGFMLLWEEWKWLHIPIICRKIWGGVGLKIKTWWPKSTIKYPKISIFETFIKCLAMMVIPTLF